MPDKVILTKLPDWEAQAYKEIFFSEIKNELDYIKSFEIATKIIRNNRPILYKYRRDNDYCLDDLRNSVVHLSCPSNYNDPYDSAFSFDILNLLNGRITELAKTYSLLIKQKATEENLLKMIQSSSVDITAEMNNYYN